MRPLEKRSWWVVMDGGSGRVVGFKRTVPEEEPGASLDEVAARRRVDVVLRGLDLDPSRLALVSSKVETRKARRDHRLVFESPADAAGEARRRVVVELAAKTPAWVALGEAVWRQLGPTMRAVYERVKRREPPMHHRVILAARKAGDEPGLRLAVRTDVTQGLRHLTG